MKRPSAAVVAFVKTPGLSPVKTRLAEALGRECAEEFYRLSVAAVESTMRSLAELNDVAPYWAVAEKEGLMDPRWRRFPRVSQGTGTLGNRLARVFANLGRQHDFVMAIGSDSPQITPELVCKALEILRHDPIHFAHVIGRCHDGGFYLVGTYGPLTPATWHDVPFSTSIAADCLVANLAEQGAVHELPKLSDVDEVEDLALIKDELIAVADHSPAQRVVLEWVVATHAAIA